MSGEITITTTEAAVLNLLVRCSNRLGKEILTSEDWSMEQDLWYNYFDQRDLIESAEGGLFFYLEKLISHGLIKSSAEGYRLMELGKSFNATLTQKAEAHATELWESSKTCKAVRRDLYGRQMRILSGQEFPADVPLFNLLSDKHAEAINHRLLALIHRHKKLNILDFGCGVISRIPELFMQRPDLAGASYVFADHDSCTLERLREKHKERENFRAIASGVTEFNGEEGMSGCLIRVRGCFFTPETETRHSNFQPNPNVLLAFLSFKLQLGQINIKPTAFPKQLKIRFLMI